MRPTLVAPVLLAVLLFSGCRDKPVARFWTAMDCNFAATLHGRGGKVSAEKALDSLESESRRLEAVFSDYQPLSLLQVLRGRAGDTVVVGREIALVLRKALSTMHASGDAFDPGMHDLKALWGIGTDLGHVPPTDSVELFVRRRFGFLPGPADTLPEPFAVLPDDRVVLRADSLPIDLGGIAKGYAVDRLSGLLDSLGWPVHLVQGGGEIVVHGRKAEGPWHVGVKNPRRLDTVVGVISLDSGAAVSTSGDYERFFVDRGVRYHHVFDPRTGGPSRNGTISVTVLCRTSLDCDAYTKPFFVMGPARSRRLADSLGLRAYWIREDGRGGMCSRSTGGWNGRLDASLPECPADW